MGNQALIGAFNAAGQLVSVRQNMPGGKDLPLLSGAQNSAVLATQQQARQAAFLARVKPVGFNSYALLLNRLYDPNYGVTTLLDYCVGAGANTVRMLWPCYALSEWTDLVFSAGFPAPGRDLVDSDFRSTFLTASDYVFDQAAARGVTLLPSLFFNCHALPPAFSESDIAACSTTSQTYAFMARVVRWFAARYAGRALGGWSVWNEPEYDATGAAHPTPAAIAAVFAGLAAEFRAFDSQAAFCCELVPLPLVIVQTPQTFDSEFAALKVMFEPVDIVALHLYTNSASVTGCAFTGPSVFHGTAFAPSPSNDLGFEGFASWLSAASGLCAAMGKPFMLGETGIPNDIEADTATTKKHRALTACTRYAAATLLWDLADLASPISDQTAWQIRPGTTRGNTFAALLVNLNAARPKVGSTVGGGMKGLRLGQKPLRWMTGVRGTANSAVSFAATAAMAAATTPAVMFWLRKDVAPATYERIAVCATTGSGYTILSTGGTLRETYCSYSMAGGEAMNNAGRMPASVVGEAEHVALIYRRVAGQLACEMWLNGMYWSVQSSGTNAYVGTVAGTVCYLLGIDQTNGSPVSLQDFAWLPSATPEDVWAHMSGAVLPHSLVHLRAGNGGVLDLSRANVGVTVGANVGIGQ